MKNVYVRDNNSILKISIKYFIALLPLIIYGFYKNGIYLYSKHLISFISMFKPLLFVFTGLMVGCLVNIIYENGIKKSDMKIFDVLFSSFHILYGLLIGCLSSINVNYFLFLIVIFIVLMTSKVLNIKSINLVAISSLVIILLSYLFGKFSYLNVYEASSLFNLNATDYLIGRGSGGIATTFIGGLVFSLIILWSDLTYKREITIYSVVSFSMCILFYLIYQSNIANIFDVLFTNGILFSLIFVAPDTISSSYTKVGKVIYGISVGILTFLLYLLNPAFACLGAILISSILSSLFDMKFE